MTRNGGSRTCMSHMVEIKGGFAGEGDGSLLVCVALTGGVYGGESTGGGLCEWSYIKIWFSERSRLSTVREMHLCSVIDAA